jgi:Sec-independent protein secretion pathway component TatC
LQELKIRGLYSLCHWILAFCLIYYYKESLLYLSAPTSYFIVTNLFEALWASALFCFWFSIVQCLPSFFLQFYLFIRPALYKYEIRYANKFLSLICILSLTGFFGLIWFFPKLWSSIIISSLENHGFVSIYIETNLQTYVFFLINCLYVIFCSSVFFFGLSPTCSRRMPYFFITFIASLVSPADFFTFVIILIFWFLLYELIVVFICIFRTYTGKALKLNRTPMVQANHARDKGKKTFQPRVIS